MFAQLLDHFQSSPLTICGPFLVLLLCGLGVLIPEDIVLLAAGALGVIEGRSWMEVSALMYAGVMLGDTMFSWPVATGAADCARRAGFNFTFPNSSRPRWR